MRFNVPIKVEVKGAASSSHTLELIERRLALLAQRTDEDAERERQYLMRLKARKTE